MSDRSDIALRRWGDALRHRRDRCRRLARYAASIVIAVGAVVLTMAVRPMPRLVWNASASVPVGLYRIANSAGPIERGDLVLVHFPTAARSLAAHRHYLPSAVPALKYVAATAGDTVCAHGADVAITGRLAVRRLAVDRRGRPLPWWRGCRRVRAGQILLLNAASAVSFDGRYFGITAASAVIGKANPIWTR